MEVIYTVCSSSEEAKLIGKILVQEKLCACVNILPGMESIYFWEGKIVEDEEVVLLIKTRKGFFDKISQKIKSLHSYEVPCVFSLSVNNVTMDYVTWMNNVIES